MAAAFIAKHILRCKYYQTAFADKLLCIRQRNIAGADINPGRNFRFGNIAQMVFVCKKSYLATASDRTPTPIQQPFRIDVAI